MECFNHASTNAVGICKHCSKALCRECAHDTGNGLACKETCIEKVMEVNKIIEHNTLSFGVRKTSKFPPVGVLTYIAFTILFVVWGVIETAKRDAFQYPLFVFAAIFAVLGAIVYYKIKKIKNSN